MIKIVNLVKKYNRKETEEDIVIGYSALRISLPLFVAVENLYFKKEKVRVKLERFDTAQPLVNALVSGSIQAGGYSALPISLNISQEKNIDLYHITSILEGSNHQVNYLLISSKNRDLDWKKIRGKKIGILPTHAYQIWIKEILKQHNLTENDVDIIPVDSVNQIEFLDNGSIDLLFTNDPMATTIIETGVGVEFQGSENLIDILGDPYIFGTFNVRKDFADNNKIITQKVSNALDRAIEYIQKNPEKSKKIMKKYIHETDKKFVKFYPNPFYQKNQNVDINLLQYILDKYVELDILKNKVDVQKIMFNRLDRDISIDVKKIFSNLSLDINKGDVIGLFGPNGSGKSTLLGLLSGQDKEYTGSIELNSNNISFVHQRSKDTLLPWMTCKENILLSRKYRNLNILDGEKLLELLAHKMKIDFSMYSYPSDLSGGQQQVVAILRGLVSEPEILLLDEPFSALDIVRRKNIINVFKNNLNKDMTTIICSHRGNEISSYVNRVVVFQNQPVDIIQDFNRKNSTNFEKLVDNISFIKYEK